MSAGHAQPGASIAEQTPREAVKDASSRLESAGVPESRASAEVLMSELLGRPRGELAMIRDPLSATEAALYECWVLRREMREPVQRILGYAYFRSLKLDLNAETLIPRPDTESVVDAALEAVDRRGESCRVLDLGTGSGAMAISIADEWPGCEVHAADVSEDVLQLARQNAALAGKRIQFHISDMSAGLSELQGSVDLLVSNPPYVESAALQSLEPEVRDWDPRLALDGGPDGLAFYRRIFAEFASLLSSGADLVLEVGDGQAESVLRIGEISGYEPLGIRRDLAGGVRAVLLRR